MFAVGAIRHQNELGIRHILTKGQIMLSAYRLRYLMEFAFISQERHMQFHAGSLPFHRCPGQAVAPNRDRSRIHEEQFLRNPKTATGRAIAFLNESLKKLLE